MSTLTGTRALLRLALRRDRILLPVWILIFAGTAASSASATVGLYPTLESRIVAAQAANAMPALVAFYGPIDDPTSLGALSMLKMTVMGAAMVALLMIFVTIRHTGRRKSQGGWNWCRPQSSGDTPRWRRPCCSAPGRAWCSAF
ncbi:MAG: hypothetical protein WCI74_05740 [Actinomycetes bacterium]